MTFAFRHIKRHYILRQCWIRIHNITVISAVKTYPLEYITRHDVFYRKSRLNLVCNLRQNTTDF
jgi:hypothetical protein